jgi:acetyl-CoA carboxylase carboxyl transferase subunit beta
MTASGDSVAIGVCRRTFGDVEALVVEWNFMVRGGTFGEAEADCFVEACDAAARGHLPLVTIVRSGGTRLQEGMRSLVGIPRASLALRDLALARVPHVSVAAHPTTGGVWVAMCAQADLRAGVVGATVGFSGPRVIEAMTGVHLAPGANTAESALAAGLLDALVEPADVDGWIASALHALRPGPTPHAAAADGRTAAAPTPPRHGWEQVVHSRETRRLSGGQLAAAMLDRAVRLRGADHSVTAMVGRVDDRPVVTVAVAAERAGRVTPAGYRLLVRAIELAGRLGLPLLTLVDTAGADPLPASEDAGVASAIAAALDALLRCDSTTVAVVHGEGGSGGALAAAACDVVAVTDTGWFAALSPEGAAAALRQTPEAAADVMRVAPAELLADGFADAVVATEPERLRAWLVGVLDANAGTGSDVRRTDRERRWRGPLVRRPLDDSP